MGTGRQAVRYESRTRWPVPFQEGTEMIHSEAHPLAGQTVTLALSRDAPDFKSGDEYRIEDWWDRVSGRSWMDASGTAVCDAW